MNGKEILEKLGFTEKEAQVYLALLTQGGLSYAELASTTKINRTTCYSVVRSLIEKEIATEDLGSNIVKTIPKDPANLWERLQKEQAQLNKKVELAKRAATELSKLVIGKRTTEPRLTHIDEGEILDFLYKRTEKWNGSIAKYDNTLWGFESAEFERDYREYIAWFWQQPSAINIQVKLFSDNEGLRNTGVNPKTQTTFKYLTNVNFTTNIWVYGDYIVLLSLEEHPYYLLEMKEPLFAQNFREYFKAIWNAHEHIPGLGK